ncbi:hypothetical protein J2X45_002062 [Caulobacter sp. BE264]|nr:hypothetical protein [Caulobacter sp. BE264]
MPGAKSWEQGSPFTKLFLIFPTKLQTGFQFRLRRLSQSSESVAAKIKNGA